MNKIYRLLIINPGSTSTKIAVFDNEKPSIEITIRHNCEELEPFDTVIKQYAFRKNAVLSELNSKDIDVNEFDSIIGRGGLLKPMESGTYRINEKMVADLKAGVMGQHASNLGAIISYEIASQINIPSFIVDPVVVDEMDEIAKISGLPDIRRISIFHALNQKAIAKRAAKELGKSYNEINLIVAHLGGGISVGVHKNGRVIDVNQALEGEGPFSPERSGGLPSGALVDMCYSGKFTIGEIKKKLVGKGGLFAYLGTNNSIEVEKNVIDGNKEARLVYEAMAYQVAKEIGSCATVLKGKIDAICLTGGLANNKLFISWIKDRISFLGLIKVYPGEDEMFALAEGGLRVLRNEEQVKEYK